LWRCRGRRSGGGLCLEISFAWIVLLGREIVEGLEERYLEVDFVDAVAEETARVLLDRDCSSHFAR